MALAVEVWSADAPWQTGGTLLHTCVDDRSRHCMDVLNDAGELSFEVSLSGADASWLTRNRVVKFRRDGSIVFSARIGPRGQDS